MYRRADIHAILLDPLTERPILILKDREDGRVLPIWIGASEANAIALELEKVRAPRPMTHDLLCDILGQVGFEVARVHVRELRDSTYFADIFLVGPSGEVPVDARPSDAVALAVRTGAPIFVHSAVFEAFAESQCGEEPCSEKVQRWLDDLHHEEVGQYEM